MLISGRRLPISCSSLSHVCKPTITQHAAALCGFEINYRPEVNWLTYDLVLKFSQYLKDELVDLRPRDMIDVQSFMWCIAPEQ